MFDEIVIVIGDYSFQVCIYVLLVDSIIGYYIMVIIVGVVGSQYGGIFWDDEWELDVMFDGIFFVFGDLIVVVVF